MIAKPIVYLAGPMSGLSWEKASEWRWQAYSKLRDHYDIIDPVRPRPETDRKDVITLQKHTDHDLHISRTATGITTADQWYIDKCDWIFANFTDAVRPSFGTLWEMGYGWGTNKKILSVVQKDSMHDHPFVRRRSHVFTESVEEAIEYFKAVAI